jgi:hypothetical protein
MMTTPKTSRELLHRLLHATDTAKPPSQRDRDDESTTRRISATTTTTTKKKPPRETAPQHDGDCAPIRREELLERQARKLLRQDAIMVKLGTASNIRNSGSNPDRPRRRTNVGTTGAVSAAARTSAIPRIPDRRYNRDRDLKERKRQRLEDLAAALKAVQKEAKKAKTTGSIV